MSGKQMEGDNQRRRALARRARAGGRQPAETGVTFGSSKQADPRDHRERGGPRPVGQTRKTTPDRGGPAPDPGRG